MAKYIVNIRMTEDYTIKVEADDADYAIAEAFERRYAWVSKYNANSFEVEVEEIGE